MLLKGLCTYICFWTPVRLLLADCETSVWNIVNSQKPENISYLWPNTVGRHSPSVSLNGHLL